MQGLMDQATSTEILVERARAGDRESFDRLVERFRDRLLSAVQSWSRFQLGPPLEGDEIVQETFVVSFESLGRFQWVGEDAFFRWLCGIAKRVVLKSKRQAIRSRQVGSSCEIVANDVSPSRAHRRDERFDRLKRSLDHLSPEQREAIGLARIEGLSIKEVAIRMNRSPASVKHLIARGLKELRDRLGDTASLHLPPRRLDAEDDGHDG